MAIFAGAAVAIILAGVLYFKRTQPALGPANAKSILVAAQTYAKDLKLHGQAVPQTVDLKDLLAKGLLQPGDVKGFAGIQVTIYLAVDPNNPQDVLMRARLQDGSEMAVLADGSVQSLRQ